MGEVMRHWGQVDVLVNNAASPIAARTRRHDAAVTRRVMEVNFFGSVHCTRAALDCAHRFARTDHRRLQRRRLRRRLIACAPATPRSKHALHGFFGSLRAELAGDGWGADGVPSVHRYRIDKNALGGDGAPARHAQQIVGARARREDIAAAILRAAQGDRQLLLPGAWRSSPGG